MNKKKIAKTETGMNPPKQSRTHRRVMQVIQTAEKLLVKMGLESISIPEIANASKIPRASIYQFFPTKYDLLHHMAQLHLQKLVSLLKEAGLNVIREHPHESMTAYGRMVAAAVIETTAKFYNESAVARLLILSGPLNRQVYLRHQIELKKFSQDLRDALKAIRVDDYLPQQPDSMLIIIEMIFTCMKHGYYTEDRISERICEEAYRLATAYLNALKEDQFSLKAQRAATTQSETKNQSNQLLLTYN